jgi:hypothetical protein
LAVATSIDALMVGLSFAFLQASIIEPILIIGLVTFLLSLAGFYFGCGLGRVLGNKIRVVGGDYSNSYWATNTFGTFALRNQPISVRTMKYFVIQKTDQETSKNNKC